METKKKRVITKKRKLVLWNFIVQLFLLGIPKLIEDMPAPSVYSTTANRTIEDFVRGIRDNMSYWYIFAGVIIIGFLIFTWHWFDTDDNDAATKKDIEELHNDLAFKIDNLSKSNYDAIGLINKDIRDNIKRIKEADNEYGNNKSG